MLGGHEEYHRGSYRKKGAVNNHREKKAQETLLKEMGIGVWASY